jgi:hypothetical protein
MFDQLSADWPKHSCFDHRYRELAAKVLPIIKAGADPRSAMFQPFADLKAMLGSAELSQAKPSANTPVTSVIEKKDSPEKHSIKTMDPMSGEELTFIGVVRERQPSTSRIKELYKRLGGMGRKAFGLPAEQDAVQITIVDAGGEPNESYTCIAHRRRIDTSLTVGVMAWVRMEAKVAHSNSAWVVKEIHPL